MPPNISTRFFVRTSKAEHLAFLQRAVALRCRQHQQQPGGAGQAHAQRSGDAGLQDGGVRHRFHQRRPHQVQVFREAAAGVPRQLKQHCLQQRAVKQLVVCGIQQGTQYKAVAQAGPRSGSCWVCWVCRSGPEGTTQEALPLRSWLAQRQASSKPHPTGKCLESNTALSSRSGAGPPRASACTCSNSCLKSMRAVTWAWNAASISSSKPRSCRSARQAQGDARWLDAETAGCWTSEVACTAAHLCTK